MDGVHSNRIFHHWDSLLSSAVLKCSTSSLPNWTYMMYQVCISASSLEAAARDLRVNIKNKTAPFITQYLKIVDLSAELSCRGRISLCAVTVCARGSTLTFFFACTGHTGSPFIHTGPPSIRYSHTKSYPCVRYCSKGKGWFVEGTLPFMAT